MSGAPETAEEEKAYREIADQRRAKSSQLAQAQNAIMQKKKVKRRSELCLAEVQALPEDTVSYKAVGRMFISCPLPSIKRDLGGLIRQSEEDLLVLEPQEKYLEREIQGIDKTMEEMADDQDQKRAGGK